jgi:hypothetical protein
LVKTPYNPSKGDKIYFHYGIKTKYIPIGINIGESNEINLIYDRGLEHSDKYSLEYINTINSLIDEIVLKLNEIRIKESIKELKRSIKKLEKSKIKLSIIQH